MGHFLLTFHCVPFLDKSIFLNIFSLKLNVKTCDKSDKSICLIILQLFLNPHLFHFKID